MSNINKGTATIFHATGKPYTSISNSVVDSISNPDALAIWTFLQTKDSGWKVLGNYLQDKFGLGRKRYSDAMSYLEAMGLIQYEVQRNDLGQVLGRRIIVNYEPVLTEVSENPHVGEPTLRATHTSVNRQQPIKDSLHIKEPTNNSMSSKPDNAVAKQVIDYLNLKTGRKYQHTKTNIGLVNARIKEGITVEQLHQVVDQKCKEWTGSKFEQYLRPATLFGAEKCNQYVGQIGMSVNSSDNAFDDDWDQFKFRGQTV